MHTLTLALAVSASLRAEGGAGLGVLGCKNSGSWVQDSGSGVQEFGFGVEEAFDVRVKGLRVGRWGFGFRVSGLGLRVQGSGGVRACVRV